MHRRTLLVGLLGLALPLAGCGSSSSAGAPTATPGPQTVRSLTYDPTAARLPACVHAGKAIALPAGIPTAFPFPPGTALTRTRVPIGGGIAGVGFVPSSSFASTVHFFPQQLPKAGFKVLHVEIDAPNHSEGSYSGHRSVGGWSLRSISGCPGAMSFQVSAKQH